MASTKQTQQSTEDKAITYTKISTISKLTAALGLVAFGVLYAILPERLTLGPAWLPLAIEVMLVVPLIFVIVFRRPIPHLTVRVWGFVLLGVITLALLISVVLLVMNVTGGGTIKGSELLRTALILWIANILVFALWYWEIDGGGPVKRHQSGHQATDFMFPQQADGNSQNWAPHFLDYLFVAFTGATAMSPTDTYPLTRIAKGLMMLEALIALLTIIILAGRAVNIL